MPEVTMDNHEFPRTNSNADSESHLAYRTTGGDGLWLRMAVKLPIALLGLLFAITYIALAVWGAVDRIFGR
jgi:hypothetical protein